MPTWPTSLPQRPLRNQFSRAPEDTSIKSQPEKGPTQVRRRFTASEDTISARYRLTFSQWSTLVSFYKSDTAGGSLTFDWPDPMTGSTITVRFAGPPQLSGVPAPDRVTAAVELREQP